VTQDAIKQIITTDDSMAFLSAHRTKQKLFLKMTKTTTTTTTTAQFCHDFSLRDGWRQFFYDGLSKNVDITEGRKIAPVR
jgi:hypothetical protein